MQSLRQQLKGLSTQVVHVRSIRQPTHRIARRCTAPGGTSQTHTLYADDSGPEPEPYETSEQQQGAWCGQGVCCPCPNQCSFYATHRLLLSSTHPGSPAAHLIRQHAPFVLLKALRCSRALATYKTTYLYPTLTPHSTQLTVTPNLPHPTGYPLQLHLCNTRVTRWASSVRWASRAIRWTIRWTIRAGRLTLVPTWAS